MNGSIHFSRSNELRPEKVERVEKEDWGLFQDVNSPYSNYSFAYQGRITFRPASH